MKESYQTYDFFTGRISPFVPFEMEYHSLFYVVEQFKNDQYYSEVNPASQIATIGFLAYFEAFCKHQFAAMVNIFPSLIPAFAAKRDEPKIEFSSVIAFNGDFEKNIGFLLAEKFDFGTAKSINGLFRDLLSVTPFNKEEEENFSSILHKRNLIVHHGGYYTLQYLKSKSITPELKEKVFKEAVKIDTEDYQEISDFLFQMALKITRETLKALKRLPEFKMLDSESEKSKAIEQLLQAIYDTLEVD